MTRDLPQSSPLTQRLQQRSLASMGVINLHPLSIERTSQTIARMVQREQLPSQIESRYQTGMGSSALELPQRVRVETLDRVTPAPGASSWLQRAISPIASDPVAPPSWNVAPETTMSTAAPPTFRVSRKPTAEAISAPVQQLAAMGEATSSGTPPSTPGAAVTADRVQVQSSRASLWPQPGIDVPLLMTKSATMAIDPTPAIDLIVPQLDAPALNRSTALEPNVSVPASSIDLAWPSIARLRSSDADGSPATSARVPTATTAALGQMPDVPRVRVDSIDNPSPPVAMPTIALNAQPAVIARLPVALPSSIAQTTTIQTTSFTAVNAMSSPPGQTPPAIVVPLSSRPVAAAGEIVNRQPSAAALAQPLPVGVDRALPLHSQIPVQTIVRQPESIGASIAMPTPAMPAPPPPAEKSAPNLEPDLHQITDRVSRLLTRQLIVERERRGTQRW